MWEVLLPYSFCCGIRAGAENSKVYTGLRFEIICCSDRAKYFTCDSWVVIANTFLLIHSAIVLEMFPFALR